MVVLAIWATKLLLKPGPDASSASRVEEVGSKRVAFSLCSTPSVRALSFILFFACLGKFFSLPN